MKIEFKDRCLITLEKSELPYSKKGKRLLYGYKDCSSITPYTLNEAAIEYREQLLNNQKRISISGVQTKLSMKVFKKQMILAESESTHIVKPKTNNLLYNEYVPVNEHLTMLIAKNVFGIETATCGLILFKDYEPAYVTKRFDVAKDGNRYLKEDFASVLQRTATTHGKDFKYNNVSYEDMAIAIDKFIPTPLVQKEKLFKLIVFNYLISNGDAHLKNFSVISYQMDTPYYVLAPAYDLLCTRLHINDNDLALGNHLYDGDEKGTAYSSYGYHTYQDFIDFGLRIGLLQSRIDKIIKPFTTYQEKLATYVTNSYLSETLKQKYMECYHDKLKRLQTIIPK
jgi:serine/threonine-protein kinase HipA